MKEVFIHEKSVDNGNLKIYLSNEDLFNFASSKTMIRSSPILKAFYDKFAPWLIEFEDCEADWPDLKSLYDAARDCFELIFLNQDMHYLLTITVDPKYPFSRDPVKTAKMVTFWLENQSRLRGLKCVMVPELSRSLKWHFHCMINDGLNFVNTGRGRCNSFASGWKYGYTNIIDQDGAFANSASYMAQLILNNSSNSIKTFGTHFWTFGL